MPVNTRVGARGDERVEDADRALVEAAAGGDIAAFESLVRRNQTRLIGYLKGLTNAESEPCRIRKVLHTRALWRRL